MRLLTLALVVGMLATAACNRVRVEDVKGPDGGEWVKVSCRHMDRHCYETASRMCPSGYYFAESAGMSPTHTREVDEADAQSAPVSAAAAAPQAGVNTKTLPPQDSWSHDMYSRKSGAILVKCTTSADRTASN